MLNSRFQSDALHSGLADIRSVYSKAAAIAITSTVMSAYLGFMSNWRIGKSMFLLGNGVAIGMAVATNRTLNQSRMLASSIGSELESKYSETEKKINAQVIDLTQQNRDLTANSQHLFQTTERNRQLEQYIETLKEQISKLNSEIQQIHDSYQGEYRHVLDTAIQEQREKQHQGYLSKIRERNSVHRKREQILLAEIQTLQGNRDAMIQHIKRQYEELIEEYDQTLAGYKPKLAEIHASFETQVSHLIQERDRIYQQLQVYHAAKRFNGGDSASINGNRLIDFFLTRNIICDAEKCETHRDFDLIWLRPRNPEISEMRKHTEALQLSFELLESPEFTPDSGCVRVNLVTAHTAKARTAKSATIDEAPADWLIQVLAESNHYRITAPTDSGKSTFLNNVIAAQRIIALQDESPLRETLLDPKYPFTDWDGVNPQYKGFDACIEGMESLGDAIDERFDLATQAVEAGNPIPDFDAHFWAVDEMEVLVDEARDLDGGSSTGKVSKRIARLLRKGLKLGRGLTKTRGKGIKVAYITQSPLCSRINLNKDDFDNSTNIFINENIPIALSNELDKKMSSQELAYLNKQYQLRRQRGDEYFALVKTPKRIFIASLPSPGAYAGKLAELQGNAESSSTKSNENHLSSSQSSKIIPESTTLDPGIKRADSAPSLPPLLQDEKQIACPECESISMSKNGTKRGLQYYICKDCKKQFNENTAKYLDVARSG